MTEYKIITTYTDGITSVEFDTEEVINMIISESDEMRKCVDEYEISTIEVEWVEDEPEIIFSL